MKKTIITIMVAVFAAITTPALADNHTQHNSKHVECTCTEGKQTQCEHKDDCKNCQHCTENKNCNCCDENSNCKNCQHHKANGVTCANCQNCDENCNNCNKKCTDCDSCKCCEHKKSFFSKLKFW